MAKYDFDQLIPRRGTNSVKWDEEPAADILPMWVADMDFRTAPCVVEALRRRVEHGVYGYATVPESYYGAVTSWFARRHGWAPGADWILPVTGVIPALSAILRALTRPGDRVLVLTPVYNHFFIAIDNSGCSAAECELTYGDNRYTVDFDALERRAADPAVKLMLLCNPHNPAGRVWTPEELRRIGDICLRRDILVVADEIHCELVMPGFRYTPFASLSEEFARRSVTCASPSKAFNLAGVQVANIFAADAGLRERIARSLEIHCELVMPGFRYTPFASLSEEFARRSVTCASPSKAFNLAGVQVANIFAADAGLRERIARSLEINETGMISPFAIEALTAAYTDGAEWLDALNGYLWENYLFLRDYFARHLPQFPVLPLEGTYLVWADCRAAGLSSDTLTRRLLDEGRLHVNSGSMYGAAGEGFIRLNIACPRKLLAEGLDRLKRVLTT